MKKRYKRNKSINQISFYFEDYFETNKKNRILKKSNNFKDRIYLLFFFFFSLILIFSIKITHISLEKKDMFNLEKQTSKFSLVRRDIVDRYSKGLKGIKGIILPTIDQKHAMHLYVIRLNLDLWQISRNCASMRLCDVLRNPLPPPLPPRLRLLPGVDSVSAATVSVSELAASWREKSLSAASDAASLASAAASFLSSLALNSRSASCSGVGSVPH